MKFQNIFLKEDRGFIALGYEFMTVRNFSFSFQMHWKKPKH